MYDMKENSDKFQILYVIHILLDKIASSKNTWYNWSSVNN
jgi:hypothetical protein